MLFVTYCNEIVRTDGDRADSTIKISSRVNDEPEKTCHKTDEKRYDPEDYIRELML